MLNTKGTAVFNRKQQFLFHQNKNHLKGGFCFVRDYLNGAETGVKLPEMCLHDKTECFILY